MSVFDNIILATDSYKVRATTLRHLRPVFAAKRQAQSLEPTPSTKKKALDT